MYPFPIRDLSSEFPLILSGRYQGSFPDTVKAKGILADMSSTVIDMKVQKAKDVSLDKVRWQPSNLIFPWVLFKMCLCFELFGNQCNMFVIYHYAVQWT